MIIYLYNSIRKTQVSRINTPEKSAKNGVSKSFWENRAAFVYTNLYNSSQPVMTRHTVSKFAVYDATRFGSHRRNNVPDFEF